MRFQLVKTRGHPPAAKLYLQTSDGTDHEVWGLRKFRWAPITKQAARRAAQWPRVSREGCAAGPQVVVLVSIGFDESQYQAGKADGEATSRKDDLDGS